MPHKRSPASLLYRAARRTLFQHAYYDQARAETVSRLSRIELLDMFNLDGVPLNVFPDIERGEVLVSSRGDGSLQCRTH